MIVGAQEGVLVTKLKRAILQKLLRECINQANAKYSCTLIATNYILALVSQELSTVRGRLATSAEGHIHHYNLEPSTPISPQDHEQFVKARQAVLYDTSQENFANYFLNWRDPITKELVLFGHPVIAGTHLEGWYDNPLSPVYEESFRRKISTTPDCMFTLSVASVHCGIDCHVEGRLLRSGNVLQFGGELYAHIEQGVYTALMAAHEMHPEKIDKFLFDLHQRGLRIMRKQMDIASPTKSLKDMSTGPSYSHLDQSPTLQTEQQGTAPLYPDMPGRYSPVAQFPPQDDLPPLHYDLSSSCSLNSIQSPGPQLTGSMPGGYSNTMGGDLDILAGLADGLDDFTFGGPGCNFNPDDWNPDAYPASHDD
ncbi:hypothetical protein BDR07DRAFT_1477633 [Suillus spraguei]|nr:hypothetical protein BDR07DRAFT_1477633 [Suillus spraguei]